MIQIASSDFTLSILCLEPSLISFDLHKFPSAMEVPFTFCILTLIFPLICSIFEKKKYLVHTSLFLSAQKPLTADVQRGQ